MTELYPLGLLLAGKKVVVVGGGAVATRRIPPLLAADAHVVMVAPAITPALQGLVSSGQLTWIERVFEPADLDGAWLVQVAIDDHEAAAGVSEAAAARHIFCVRADDRHAATAWTPAVTRHGPVTVAVIGGGRSRRAIAVRDGIREWLSERAFTERDDDLVSAAAHRAGVALIGAGPGDPELITVKGRRLLAEADVVVVDRLAPGLLLEELRPDVEVIDASKIPYGPARTQQEINQLLVDRALAGKFVVRLKGGDPYVFGRGGEELLACVDAGLTVTVVPGVTSAISVPSAAGIPVTHRGVAHEFVVVSGHLAPDNPASLVDWAALARLRGTICVLMGLTHLAAIAAALLAGGRPPGTPVAAIQEGTTGRQRVVRAPLSEVAAVAAAAGLQPPVVVVIGGVVDALPTAIDATAT